MNQPNQKEKGLDRNPAPLYPFFLSLQPYYFTHRLINGFS